jgi:hypothetical protein
MRAVMAEENERGSVARDDGRPRFGARLINSWLSVQLLVVGQSHVETKNED